MDSHRAKEQKRRAQAKALIEFFNGVIPPNADLSTYASREEVFNGQFEARFDAMSQFKLKPLHPRDLLYSSFYENYFLPFIQQIEQDTTSSTSKPKSQRGKKRDISALIPDIQNLYRS